MTEPLAPSPPSADKTTPTKVDTGVLRNVPVEQPPDKVVASHNPVSTTTLLNNELPEVLPAVGDKVVVQIQVDDNPREFIPVVRTDLPPEPKEVENTISEYLRDP